MARAVFGLGCTAPAKPTIESGGLHYLPLAAPMQVRGVLVVESGTGTFRGMALERDLASAAALIAIALERIQLVEVAHRATLSMHSERLRNTLLSALSHDLRTPLTAILGSAEALRLAPAPLDADRTALVEGIATEARRTAALVENILDMARLESGEHTLRIDWHPLAEIAGAALAERAALLGARNVMVSLPDDLPWYPVTRWRSSASSST